MSAATNAIQAVIDVHARDLARAVAARTQAQNALTDAETAVEVITEVLDDLRSAHARLSRPEREPVVAEPVVAEPVREREPEVVPEVVAPDEFIYEETPLFDELSDVEDLAGE